ncbi:hypothetical protein [Parasitella parasitica]|uniref:Uncharacterized protein n=1 Tax=Parasitella parasitica TaxID=35722 RepID=A0A0B7NB62_9FUNG|nr:hypothetical protein [Parasitella parasitica]
MSKGYYVCERAAQAIIAEIRPMRVSSDALQAINTFLDEFLALLVITAASLDLVLLKAAVIQLLPYSLGKTALVEAEIELQNRIPESEDDEQNQLDLSNYEKMRLLKSDSIDKIIPILQAACADFCTLAAENHNSNSPDNNDNSNEQDIIAPVVVIYVTAIVEHIAEYVLNSVAMTADQTDAEHIRVKEVLLCLRDCPQVGSLFRGMNLKEKLEKRASTYFNYLPSPVPSPVSINRDQLIQRHSNSTTPAEQHFIIDYSNEGEDNSDHDPRATPSSTCSMRSSESINDRPLSIMSNGTVKSSGSKSRFNFFGSSNKKEKRTSISLNFTSSKRSTSNPPSIASPTTPSYTTASMDFEDLMRSGTTKKVSLTPNRLRSIEVKTDDSTTAPTPWEKPHSHNAKSHNRTKKRSASSSSPSSPPPIPPLPKLNREQHPEVNRASPSGTDSAAIVTPASTATAAIAVDTNSNTNTNNNNSPPLTPASSVASRPSQRSRHSIIYEEKSPRASMKSTYSTNEDSLADEPSSLKRNPSKISTTSSIYSRRSTISGIERPSSMVVKRASTGSRPPSFHENVHEIMGNTLLAAANGISLDEKLFQGDQQQEQQHNMIYVLPSTASRSPISSRFSASSSLKARTVDRGCQTEPASFRTLHKIPAEDDQEEDEEWFLDESEDDEDSYNAQQQEEQLVAEWLLGNA